jgi:hypothetical protein
MDNEVWKLDTGWLAAYTEDRDLMRRIKRYKPSWRIMADYHKNDRLIGLQYKIPIEHRRAAERMFYAKNQENKAI